MPPPDFSARCPGRTGATASIRLAMIAAVLPLSLSMSRLAARPDARAGACR
ncbi:hypothetical protein BURCENK562V_C3946 [Burkholderia cenocepacia K56-2Valvano]|nr:hypothetical protein BURCENK562V_C3946 [Burkholderia cenocepacia K56-2Valvano]